MSIVETPSFSTLAWGGHQPTQILLIEDYEDDAIIARALLAGIPDFQYAVEWASTYEAGLQKIQAGIHHVCLLDYNLGSKSGLELLKEAQLYGVTVPIIMMTGTTDRTIDIQALELGAADYIIKGETNSSMLERVIRHARERQKAASEREALQQQLLEKSRRLGMAEVATDVLHNIGNLLNGLNVSMGLLAEQLHTLPISDVPRVTALLEAQKDQIRTFLMEDVKGKRLLPFLNQLGNDLTVQHRAILEECDKILGELEQVKQIILSQENRTRVENLQEGVSFQLLIEQALSANQQDSKNGRINVVRKFDAIPKMMCVKHVMLQILTNLIRNAFEAISKRSYDSHQLSLRLHWEQSAPSTIRIIIQDTGVGLSQDHVARVFSQDLSLREKHTIGLHQSAVAVKNFGGCLSASSEGLGYGSTFTLVLPARPWEGSEPL